MALRNFKKPALHFLQHMKRLRSGVWPTAIYTCLTILLIGCLFLFPTCSRSGKPKQYVIGFSQCVASDVWRRTMLEEMNRELSFHSNVSLLYEEADGNS